MEKVGRAHPLQICVTHWRVVFMQVGETCSRIYSLGIKMNVFRSVIISAPEATHQCQAVNLRGVELSQITLHIPLREIGRYQPGRFVFVVEMVTYEFQDIWVIKANPDLDFPGKLLIMRRRTRHRERLYKRKCGSSHRSDPDPFVVIPIRPQHLYRDRDWGRFPAAA